MGVGNSQEVGLEPSGPPLSLEQEQRVIDHRWRKRD
jgi:hypothetical protein